ncbi:MAG: LamG domain-containing protein [Bacteroidales bacterium]|jgi:hypothetical protein|nr:LamG domain-containing protein [Bacteroidales bacterium]
MQKTTLLLFSLLYSCTGYLPYPEIEAVLQQAGGNRAELEQVLKHYAENPSDSLKLRAAEFLIVNMPGKYSQYYDAPWNDVATVYLRWTSSSNKQRVLDTYGLGKMVIREDVKYITADYLINNIELAFKVWRERPWGKHIPFDVFCEEILPYRVSTEPLENWREKALASFADLNLSFEEDSTVTAVEACSRVNALLPKFRIDKDFPAMSYSQLMASARGPCENMTALATFAMRALGIPVMVDFTPLWLNGASGHSWNTVCDSAGRHISFIGTESHPGQWHQGNTLIKPKAYRKTFAIQRDTAPEAGDIPGLFRNRDMIDVSHEYDGFADVVVPIRFPLAGAERKNIYLAALRSNQLSTLGSHQWSIVGRGRIENGEMHFASAGKNTFYLPVYYENNKLIAANYPFVPDDSGKIWFFPPADGKDDATRDFLPDETWLPRMPVRTFEDIPPKGLWRFEDARRLGKADIGKDLVLCGDRFTQVAGPTTEDRAARVGRGSYFRCFHGMAANGGGWRVNEFTLMIRFKIPESKYYALFQTSVANDDHPESIITDRGAMGLVTYSAVTIRPGVWYRLVISSGPERYDYFIDGKLVHEINKGEDDRFSLSPDELLLFADDGSFDNEFDIAEVAIWDKAM